MPKINVAIVHGIGKNGHGFSKDLTKGIIFEFNSFLATILKTPASYALDLNFIEIVWDDILSMNQAKLADIFRAEFKRRNKAAKFNATGWFIVFMILSGVFSFIFKHGAFWALMVFPLFVQGKKLLDRLRSDFAAEFVSDIIAYGDKDSATAIHQRVYDEINKHAAPMQKEPLTFIAHSLGTVITSNFIYDQQKRQNEVHPAFTLCNFFTMGSPLALFSLRSGPEIFKNPIHLEDPLGRWINLFDDDDLVGYPLKNLNDAYNSVVHKDLQMEVGLLGISHVQYWTDKNVHRLIARKLALDWLRVNQKIDPAVLNKLYTEY